MKRSFARTVMVIAWMGLTMNSNHLWAQNREASPESQPEALPLKLSLEEARGIAFRNNWDLLAARSDVDQATAQKILAKELPNPTFSYSTQKINIDGRPASTPAGNGFWERNYDTFFVVNQLFEIAGKRSNRQKSAQSGQEAAQDRLEDARRILGAGVAKAYSEVLLGEAKVKALQQSAGALRKEADLAQVRFNAGEISRADQEQIEIAAERFELDSKTAEANFKTSKIALEVLLGIKNPTGHWKPSDSLEILANKRVASEIPESLPDRPDQKAAEAVFKKSEADLRLQKALRVPDPTFLLQYEHEPPDQPNTLGFGVSFPLPLFSHNAGNIHSAFVARENATRELEKTKARIASEREEARLNYQEAFSRWRRYRDSVRPKSEKILETVSFAYRKGGASLLDFLAAERSDNEIRIATAQAAADTISSAANYSAALYESSSDPSEVERKGKP